MSRRFFAVALGALVMVAFGATAFGQYSKPGQTYSPVKVTTASRFARSAPLRSMRYPNLPPILRRVIGNRTLSKAQIEKLREKLVKSGELRPATQGVVIPNDSKKPALSVLRRVKDPALQTKAPRGPNDFTTPGAGFDGLGLSTNSSPGFTPPDTNAAVGENYVVETVNVEFAVYSKTNGNLVFGPLNIANLWTSLGGDCLNDGTSDPIVNYDQLAQRWVISQITTSGAVNNFHCVAVSQTSDPTGAYYLYAFPLLPGSDLPDYPKLAVWPDAYYANVNDFQNFASFAGVIFAAYDRTAMLAGDPNAQMIEFGPQADNAYSDLPVNYDGVSQAAPPAGAPGLYVNYISPNLYGAGAPYAVEVWSMHVDWTNPANSTLTDAAELAVDPFTDILCGNSRQCIPQESSSNKLDAITDRLMFRASYRNFGGHQSIVLMHNVGADASGNPPSGERWAELRAPSGATSGSAYSVYQQGTFAPSDTDSRWMGSIAMDHVGNMAMGYSVSGPSQDPEIAYTGRSAGDPLGQMTQPETVLQAAEGSDTGTGSQPGRWGDYTSMVVDPTDDCTFWYANQYWNPTGDAFSWSTHIGSMKFTNCSIGPQGTLAGTVTAAATGSAIGGATITIMPGNITTQTGDDGTYSIGLAPGDYTVSASDFGYAPQVVSATIALNQTTTQNFSLALAPTATLHGLVTDGSGHGYRLYAEIKISVAGTGQVADVWTNPQTGHYSVQLPEGTTYTLDATAAFGGYNAQSRTVTLTGDTDRNFRLTVTAACSAPGYQIAGISADFNEGSFPPAGWTVTNPGDYPTVWMLASQLPADNENWTGGTGDSASADTNALNNTGDPYDTSLVTPPIPVTSLHGATVLTYLANYQPLGGDAFDLDISTDGGNSWTQVLHWTTAHGTLLGPPGVDVTQDLAGFLPASGDFQLRWRYYGTGWNWYAQIDDVKLGGCVPVPGGLVHGRVTDSNTGNGLVGATVSDDLGETTETHANPDDPNFAVGTYLFFVTAGDRTLTASDGSFAPQTAAVTVANNANVTGPNFALTAPKFTATPDHFTMNLKVGTQALAAMTIANVGNGTGVFSIKTVNSPPPTSAVATGPFAIAPHYAAHRNLATLTAKGAGARPNDDESPSAAPNDDERPLDDENPPAAPNDDESPLDDESPSAAPSDDESPLDDESPAAAPSDDESPMDDENPSAAPSDDESPNDDESPHTAGDVVSTFPAGISIYGLGGDHNSNSVWLGSPSYSGLGGDDKDHRFLLDGTNTGDVIDIASSSVLYMADIAFDDNTGTFWQASVDSPTGTTGHIYEFDPVTKQATGNSILIPSPQSERGLAFDPLTNTWYAGDFNSETIYHFDASGALLDSANVGLPITGLAYNSATGHLFVLTSAGTHAVYVLDAKNNYAQLSSFDITGFSSANAGAGLGYDCANDLIVSDYTNKVVYLVDSGETGWCDDKSIPWLTVAPTMGTLAPGASANVVLTFDGTGQKEFTTSEAYLKVTGSPYPDVIVPLTVNWLPQPVDLDVSGSVSPTGPVAAGASLAYTITVQNLPDAGGSATETKLTYEVPAGVDYVASSGATCAAPPTSAAGANVVIAPRPASVVGPAVVTCDFGTIDPNQGKLVTIAVRATADADTVSGTFTVSAREPQSGSGNTSLTLDTNPAVGPPGPPGPSGPPGPQGPKGSKGSGAFGWLALFALLGLGLAGVGVRARHRRRS